MIKRKEQPLLPAAFDRGPTPYFHGREDVLRNLAPVMERARLSRTGTTFLIQGAPGAGKTALLDKISSEANEQGWKVAKIRIKDLHSPVSMAQSLGQSYTIDAEYSAKIGIKFFEGGRVRNIAGNASVEQILQHLSPENGLVLVLDEAQYLANLEDTPTEKNLVRDTLDMIHKGDVGHPVMLLTAGLGTTLSAFQSLGISRFGKTCIVQLGALDKESERTVMHSWLTDYAKAEGDPDVWIDAITKETHGWPQHILSYMAPAVKHLESNKRQMTDGGLKYVLEKGTEFRMQYYKQRARGFSNQQRQIIASLIIDLQQDGYLEIEGVLGILIPIYGEEKAEKFFNDMLHSGILHEQYGGVYKIPIPSMRTWLLNEYRRDKEKPLLTDKTLGKVSEVKDSQGSEKSQKSRFTREH